MQFFHPEYFLLLWVLPAVWGLHVLSVRLWQGRMKRFGDRVTLETKLLPQYRKNHWGVRAVLITLVFLFSILALARPQWGEEKKKVQRKGVDLVFLLDTSLSMLAEDVKPNRFEKAQMEIKSFVRSLKGDRIGLVAFSGSSFLQAPLTLDYAAFFLFLDGIRVGYIPDPGTSLSKAIGLSIRSFPKDDMKHKALILFTDGEDLQGGMDEAIKAAKEAGVRIYTIGVGTEEGDPIPLKDDTGRKSGFKKDRAGQVVVTKLDKALLQKIAAETGAVYLPSTPGEDEVEYILKHLQSLGQRQFKEKLISEKEDHYQIFVFLAFFFLLLEMMVRVTRKNGSVSGPSVLPVLLLFFLFTGFLDTTRSLNEKGNAEFEQKKYQTALENYRKAQVKNPDDPVVMYNLGAGLYQTQQYQEAKKNFEGAIAKTKDPELKAKALYNYGNTLYRLGDFEKAIDSYKKALELKPDDQDAKYNLEFLQKSKNRMEKENQDKQKQSDKQDQKQNQDKQQNQQNQQQKPDQKKDQQQNQGDQQPQDQQGEGQQGKQGDQKQDQNQDQDQKKEPQDQQGEQNQDQKDPQDQQGQQGEKDDQKQDQKRDEGDQQDQQPKPKEDGQPEEAKPEDEQGNEPPEQPDQKEGDQPQDQPEPNQEGQPEQASPDEQQGDQPGEQGEQTEQSAGQEENPQSQQKAPLQGQMTKENALRMLDAMKDGEKDLQDLRRPPSEHKEVPPEKDW